MTMKKKILMCCLVGLISTAAFSQTYIVQVKSLENKKWGYVNSAGEIVAAPQYDRCYEFSAEGLAPIYDSKDKQFYFITAKGERIATDIKDFKLMDRMGFALEGFGDGLIPVKHKDKWGFLNKEGKLAIPAKYDEVTGFGSGHAVATLGKKIFIISTTGEETPVESGVLEVRKFSDNLAPFRAADKKFGYMDVNGKVAIKPQFESVGYFKDGIAWAKTTDGNVGYIGTDGEWVITPQFNTAGNFDSESGLARVKTGSEWGYVNKEGKVIRKNDTMVWEDFSNGLALGKKDGLFGYFNSQGEWAIKPEYDGGRDFKNGYAAVKKGNKWGIIDRSGSWVIKPEYDGIKDMELVN
jgi:hypothetical protein